ncbi:MAG: Hydroxymethylglutaryl-CoA lyase YngG [Paracidovorax wautersii]|uniref:Hydroxymethylglutaryl-CoA lyase YngG n=1 Tax=Paracidovorax wautersii TaxID=1177982 RepID=A0A7V8FLM9_9BURK|nr:MAG: Hydroxymethylglutaryl-CoA lyase YngG [Paracidovorax wautersii]
MNTNTPWSGAGRRVFMNEVGPRDGLQMEAAFVPTADKIALIDALSLAGYAKIEATAFVSATAIPALRDGDVVMSEITRQPGVIYTALVPNLRGAERAIETRTDELNLVMSVSETHNLCNLRMLRSQSLQALAQVIALAQDARVPVNVSLSCSFGCPMEGDVPAADVLDWVQRFADRGVQGVTLCDTTGMAFPPQVAALVRAVRQRWPQLGLTLHFHDTRGLALPNMLAALDAGADRFDTALGGLGGCPYAPGASGNACSEDAVHALQLVGYDTGVDLARITGLAQRLPALIGHDMPSQIAKAGPRSHRHAPPADFDTWRQRAHERQAAAVR